MAFYVCYNRSGPGEHCKLARYKKTNTAWAYPCEIKNVAFIKVGNRTIVTEARESVKEKMGRD